jgi:hypothetical protein
MPLRGPERRVEQPFRLGIGWGSRNADQPSGAVSAPLRGRSEIARTPHAARGCSRDPGRAGPLRPYRRTGAPGTGRTRPPTTSGPGPRALASWRSAPRGPKRGVERRRGPWMRWVWVGEVAEFVPAVRGRPQGSQGSDEIARTPHARGTRLQRPFEGTPVCAPFHRTGPPRPAGCAVLGQAHPRPSGCRAIPWTWTASRHGWLILGGTVSMKNKQEITKRHGHDQVRSGAFVALSKSWRY